MGYYDPAEVTSHVCGHSLSTGDEPRMLGLDPMSIEGDNGFWENWTGFDQLYWSGDIILG